MRDSALSDLAFLVNNLPPPPSQKSVTDLLVSDEGTLSGLDIWRLGKAAECASYAGVMDSDVFMTLRHLSEELREIPEGSLLLGLEHSEVWRDALAIAKSNEKWPWSGNGDKSRQQVIGEACGRLIKRGRKISFDAYGPNWDDTSLRDACRAIDHLASKIGGEALLNQCAGFVEAMDWTFEDIWLLGDRNLGIGDPKEPAVPLGWIIGLAAKHMHRPNTCRNPATAWRSLIDQAQDVAASFDCQRYSQFEDMFGIYPVQISEKVSEAVAWRGLFFTPQAPRLLLPRLRDAFEQEMPSDRHRGTRAKIIALFEEMIDLSSHLRNNGCVEIRRYHARRDYPNLYAHARAPKGAKNQKYLVPVKDPARADTSFVLFDGPEDTFIVRPVAMAIHAFCETVFGLLIAQVGSKEGTDVRGKIIETVIADACEGKTDNIWKNEEYGTKKSRQEIDVATRTGNRVTLIEAKAKVLTREGQVGTSAQFYSDYAASFLPLVRQLARDDADLRAGMTSIATAEEADELKIDRIAVSPVTFGPIGDSLTTIALMSALPGVRLEATDGDPKTLSAVKKFNDQVPETMKQLSRAAPRDEEGRLDLFTFFLFTRWLDLGQLLVALEKADNVKDALHPIRHLTTGSRDFWTDFAFGYSMRTRRQKPTKASQGR